MVLQCLPTRPGQPADRPEYFDHRYVLPVHQEYPLSKINWHEVDDALEFFEEPHVYMNRTTGRPVPISMTSVAHSCQEHFDAQLVISKMKTSRKGWPRVKYVKNAVLVDREDVALQNEYLRQDRGAMLVSGETTLVSLKPYDMSESVYGPAMLVALNAMHPKRNRDDAPNECYSYERVLTDEEIVNMWALNGEDARNRGTEAHLQLQLAVEAAPFRRDDPEVVVGLRFFDCISDEWRPYRAEWEIEYEGVAGSIDLIIARGGQDVDDGPLELAIVDYKRSVDLPNKMRDAYGKKMTGALAHLDDCDGAGYALQLSGYQYVLQKLGFVVVDRVLMSVHPDRPFCTSVPYLKDEISYLMEERFALNAARESCSMRCPLCDEPLHDAVVVTDPEGREIVVDRKIAQVKKLPILRDDDETTKVVREHVESVIVPPTIPTFALTWKKLMPPSGHIRPTFFREDAPTDGKGLA